LRQALQKASDTIRQLLHENAQLKNKERIAIIGMACRFPGGANNPEQYWSLLENGKDGVGEVPSDRWMRDAYLSADKNALGKMYTARGGFLDTPIDQFDAAFFGISPREANGLDPQQRLLLELSWEAIEHAGLIPEKLKFSRTGVYIGLSGDDYARYHRHSGSPEAIDAYSLTGTTPSTAAGRISYTLGLQGPSLALDTACSSSLVALHLATRSLRERETDMALVGGVNLMLSPENHIAFSKLQAISPDGVCRTFSADANGYVRSEGCAMVVLKRESDALKDGDNILAFICGSAVNQDGKTNGLAAPNGQAQQAVIRAALSDAGIAPEQMDYLEAHGTGTLLGDPIELEAIGQVMRGRQGDALLIGSAKSNIGHMEPAAGLGGLLKIVLALKNQKIPANLHFTQPNPHVDWERLSFKVVSQHQSWPYKQDTLAARYAGLSSFGFSGTNSHIVIAGNDLQKPDTADARFFKRPVHALALSARSPASLTSLARAYVKLLENATPIELPDICFSANTTRSQFEYRLAAVGSDALSIATDLSSFTSGTQSTGPYTGQTLSDTPGKVAWLFTGEAAGYGTMARDLYQTQPVFKQAIDQCALILDQLLDISLVRILCESDFDRHKEVSISQSVLFSFDYALAQVWLSWGGRPDFLAGYGAGQFAAACIAEVFSIEHGFAILIARAKLMQAESNQKTLAQFKELIAGIKLSAPRIPLISHSSGRLAGIEVTEPGYWLHLSNDPISFSEAIEYLAQTSVKTYLEIGPSSDLLNLVRKHASFSDEIRCLASLDASTPPWETLTHGAAQLFVAGLPMDWLAFDMPFKRLKLALPTYPFDRKRYWTDAPHKTKQPEQTTDLNHLVYSEEWVVQPEIEMLVEPHQTANQTLVAAKRWLVVGQHVQTLSNACEAAGLECLVLDTTLNDFSDLSSVTKLLTAALNDGATIAGIAYLPALCDLDQDELLINKEVFALINLARANLAITQAPLWLLNRAESSADGLLMRAPVCAILLGLCRSLWIEHTTLRGGYIEYDTDSTHKAIGEMIAAGTEDCIRFQTGQRAVLRLNRVAHLPAKTIDFDQDATYLITGGLGALGLEAARQFASKGVKHIMLLGRNPPSTSASTQVQAIKDLGVSVEIVIVDISDIHQMRALFSRIKNSEYPLRGIVHAAGVMHPHPLEKIDMSDVDENLRAKVQGAWLLHRLSQEIKLDFFVTYGSISAMTGTPELSLYTAANGFLEGLAHYRKNLGLPSLCISWGVWQTGGVVDASASQLAQRSGFKPLDTMQALRALLCLPLSNQAHVAVVDANWKQVRAVFASRSPLALLDTLAPSTLVQTSSMHSHANPVAHASSERHAEATSRANQAFQASLQQATLRNRHPLMRSEILRCLSNVLHFSAGQQPIATIGFFDMGMDSIAATEFRLMLENELGCTVSQTDVFDYPTAETLAKYLLDQIFAKDKVVAQPSPQPPKQSAASMESTNDVEDLSDEQLAALIEDEFNALNHSDSKQ
jgi:acyl transferase domain-containing protein/short-subunit dehydrogenase/acyl carrier protein